jgi:hypothetical protein
MNTRPTVLERAFDLARAGAENSVDDIKDRLRREGYGTQQIVGPTLIRQLKDLIRAARGEPRVPGRPFRKRSAPNVG